ncbi:MAG TPA: M20/M25/M40 family metallo-hydrolase [Actinocatenispora sp.]
MPDGFTADDRRLLTDLLALPTAGPLETGGTGGRLADAQRRYAEAAAPIGLVPVHHAAPSADQLGADLPLAVRERLGEEAFLAEQPSLVLRLGPELPRSATVLFNVHLDTVAGPVPVSDDGVRVTGRGAIDAKGPAVSLLAGIRAALAADPAIGRDVAVLVCAVAGEEGGAMGTIGTRPLVDAGYVGRLNVFCEPTGGTYLSRVTAAATARIRVTGHDAVDDRPGHGHNATVLLGHVAAHLARTLPGRVCVGGLTTGTRHNRVYGSGELALNLPYRTAGEGRRAVDALETALGTALAEFRSAYAGTAAFDRTASDAATITRLDWLKRDLPTIDGAPAWAEEILGDAGIPPWPADEPPFTCDAIWLAGIPDTATVVYGPGRLDTNHAHAAGEYATLAELSDHAAGVARLLTTFARRQREGRG